MKPDVRHAWRFLNQRSVSCANRRQYVFITAVPMCLCVFITVCVCVFVCVYYCSTYYCSTNTLSYYAVFLILSSSVSVLISSSVPNNKWPIESICLNWWTRGMDPANGGREECMVVEKKEPPVKHDAGGNEPFSPPRPHTLPVSLPPTPIFAPSSAHPLGHVPELKPMPQLPPLLPALMTARDTWPPPTSAANQSGPPAPTPRCVRAFGQGERAWAYARRAGREGVGSCAPPQRVTPPPAHTCVCAVACGAVVSAGPSGASSQ